MIKKLYKLIALIVIFIGILAGGSFWYLKVRGQELTPQKAAQKAVDYINQYLLPQGTTASFFNVVEEDGVYKFRLKIGDQEQDIYVTKNGKLLFSNPLDLTSQPQNQSTPPTGEVPKSDKPDVKLFVMTYCPYGLQAQKMFLSVYNLFKDKADMGIYFVDYVMHYIPEKTEINENLRQYCIQKEQKEKYYDYLSCFVEAGNSAQCLIDAKIDQTKMSSCISATDQQYNITSLYNDQSSWLSGQYPQFNVNADLSQQYGVQGSPTLVINGTIVELSSRSPEQFKQAICQAFNTPPAECSQTLSDTAFSTGFGQGTGSSTSGSCQ